MDQHERVTLLQPTRSYFVELQTTRPVALPIIEAAFSDEEEIDPRGNTFIRKENLGLNLSLVDDDRSFQSAAPHAPGTLRFLTVPRRLLQTHDVGAFTWSQAFEVQCPVFVGIDHQRISTLIRMVKSKVAYDFRFYVRAKTFFDRKRVVDALTKTGFAEPQALCLMKRDMRLGGQPASVNQWFARAAWAQGDSALTDRDLILVDEIAEVKSGNTTNTERASTNGASPVSSESGPHRNP